MTNTVSLGKLQLSRPLVTLDLEATGLDAELDRIVEIALIRVAPNGARHQFHTLVDPGVGIPEESTAVHGIDAERVKGAPSFKDIGEDVLDFLRDADLCGFNHRRFDLPLLRAEFRRLDIAWDYEKDVNLVDTQAIFHNKEPRDLTAAYRFYCNDELEGAHGALADAAATWQVLLAQLERYPDLPTDVPALDAAFNRRDSRFVDSERRFLWKNGEPVFNFGIHKGESLRKVAAEDPEFLDWILRKKFASDVKDIVKGALQGEIPQRRKEPAPDASG